MIDKRILELLQLDARVSFADLSRKLDAAEATVRFRVKRLIDNGVVTRFAALLDPAKVGFGVSGAILLKIDPVHLEVSPRETFGNRVSKKFISSLLCFLSCETTGFLRGKCVACEFKSVCGGCRARALSIRKSYLEEEPYCVYSP